jgi:hypothetical protein
MNIDPKSETQKSDFEKIVREVGFGIISKSICVKVCEHIWNTQIAPLQSENQRLTEELRKERELSEHWKLNYIEARDQFNNHKCENHEQS